MNHRLQAMNDARDADEDQLYDILNLLPPLTVKHFSGLSSPPDLHSLMLMQMQMLMLLQDAQGHDFGNQQQHQHQHQQQHSQHHHQQQHSQHHHQQQHSQHHHQIQNQNQMDFQFSPDANGIPTDDFPYPGFDIPTFNVVSQDISAGASFVDSPQTQHLSANQTPLQLRALTLPVSHNSANANANGSLNINNLQTLDTLALPSPHNRSLSRLVGTGSIYSDASLNAASPFMDAASHFSDYGNPPAISLDQQAPQFSLDSGLGCNSFDTEIALGGSILSTNLPAMNAPQIQQFLGQQHQQHQQQYLLQLQNILQYQDPSFRLTENNLSKIPSGPSNNSEVIINIDAAPEVAAAARTPSLFSNSSHNSSLHNSPNVGDSRVSSSNSLKPGALPVAGSMTDYSESLRPDEYHNMKRGRRRAHSIKSQGSGSGSRSQSRSSNFSDDGEDDDDDDEGYALADIASGAASGSKQNGGTVMSSREKMLELASPNQSTRRTQKHPSVYACHLCDKKFTRPYNLKSHLRTHTDERPFICSVCGKAFARQHDRKRHEDLHKGEKKFQCKGFLKSGDQYGCGRKFARADALRRHFQTEAGKECIRLLIEEDARERPRGSGEGPRDIGSNEYSEYLISSLGVPKVEVTISPPE